MGGSLQNSLLLSCPLDEFGNALVFKQFLFGVVVPTKVFELGDEAMDCGMALAADRDRFGHLDSREPFFEPLVGMALFGNQMVFGRTKPRLTPAKAANPG